MSAFGKHPLLSFIDDDTTVPISANNKNEEQRVLELTDNELARSKEYNFGKMKKYYYDRNTKLIEDFQDSADWSSTGTVTLSDDTVNHQINFNAVKMLENDNTASTLSMYKSISAIDLTSFNDDSVSSVDDEITIVFNVSNYLTMNILRIKLGTGPSNYYSVYYDVSTSIARNGHVILHAKKSAFTNVSMTDWSSITWVSVEIDTAVNGQNDYITMQLLQMVRVNPDVSTHPNPFQRYNEGGYINDLAPTEPWSIVWDNSINKLVLVEFEQYNYVNNQFALLIREDLINFVYKARMYHKEDTSGLLSLSWRVNDENYIECYVQNDVLYFRKRQSGSTTYHSISLTNPLIENKPIDVTIEKYGQNYIFTVNQGNELIKRAETTITISADSVGDLWLGHYSTAQFSVIEDFTISHNPNCYFPDKLYILKNETIEQSVDNTTWIEINDVDGYLQPNQMYEIELNLIYNCGSNTPDIVVNFGDISNIELIGGINVIGGGYTSTNAALLEFSKMVSYDQFTDNIILCATSGPNYAIFKFLCKTGVDGGLFRVKMHQYSTDAGNPVYVRKETYVKFEKIG